ncbi:photosystem II protein Psb27 [Oscillatoria sp. CS-180]|uniref:photosystem II protein Psb27 n=1 Tax=Oscillatoria sp. CS-180 TaxID=3021720 RepID=UPI00232ED735|nr:photosystem II protein Psb27 [Oscillatoria sp. CS-180]MDB9528751.1 photosystem II protein Psb27 [Oscillatoria sp. CS-180]
MRQLLTRFFALILVAVIGLTGCNSAGVSGQMTGDYRQDTITVIDGLRTAINLANDSPEKASAEVNARNLINDFFSRYRRDDAASGLSSFATLRTALNALAGHYSSYPNRPVPEKLKNRLEQEFRQVEAALKRGA